MGGRGCPLLGSNDTVAAERIAEALQCHMWPGMTPKELPAISKPLADAGSGSSAERGSNASNPMVVTQDAWCEQNGNASVESMERLTEEMRAVRAIEDDDKRRERACDVALK